MADRAGPVVSRLRCRGCGATVEATEAYPFRCPNTGQGDIDHVLRRVLAAKLIEDPPAIFSRTEGQPFIRFRELLHSYQSARRVGLTDENWLELVGRLDRAVSEVDGRGFRETPFAPVEGLAARLGVRQAWVKDESGNVSGSHKGRHLMGVMLWLEAAAEAGLVAEERPLAIASCGNAALAAAVVARAAGRRLEVFVPTHANASVLDRLGSLEAHMHACRRRPQESGDPCYLRFVEALGEGALPFTCQGNENGLTIDGGKTLAWEMVASLRQAGTVIDRVFLHVGGGALASSVIEGLREARDLGFLAALPRIHAVQTGGAYPLVRAYGRLTDRMLAGWVESSDGEVPEDAAARAAALATPELEAFVSEGLEYGATHRSEFMWPWEDEPRSIADGILDDETYDWLAVVEGMLESGGWPIVVSEETLADANRLVRKTTESDPCHTGTAGVAGAMTLAESSAVAGEETIAVIVSGVERR